MTYDIFLFSSTMDNSLLSNIQKLFSERVDVFGPVEFSRSSVLTGIIKITLKTLLECVRLKTFGKFGLQQLQVVLRILCNKLKNLRSNNLFPAGVFLNFNVDKNAAVVVVLVIKSS